MRRCALPSIPSYAPSVRSHLVDALLTQRASASLSRNGAVPAWHVKHGWRGVGAIWEDMEPHVLDRPVWQTLTSRQAGLALGDARAWRMEPRHGPFAAAAD